MDDAFGRGGSRLDASRPRLDESANRVGSGSTGPTEDRAEVAVSQASGLCLPPACARLALLLCGTEERAMDKRPPDEISVLFSRRYLGAADPPTPMPFDNAGS